MKRTANPDYREMLRERARVIAQEQFDRDVDFLSHLVPERICGLRVVPFTLERWLILRAGGSPFLGPGNITPIAVGQLLWVISPQYKPKARLRRWLFLKLVRKIDYVQAAEGIFKYLNEVFRDAPGGDDTTPRARFSGAAGIVDTIASEYGWDLTTIRQCDLKILFQLRRARCLRKGIPDQCSTESDLVTQRWLDQREAARTHTN